MFMVVGALDMNLGGMLCVTLFNGCYMHALNVFCRFPTHQPYVKYWY